MLASTDAALLDRVRAIGGEDVRTNTPPGLVWTDDLQSVVPIFSLDPVQ